MSLRALLPLFISLLLAACGTSPERPVASKSTRTHQEAPSARALDVVLYALGLVDTGYRYGGKNPQAGLDCSGMVSHVFGQAANLTVLGSAADIAHRGQPRNLEEIRPGDLVFFNTLNRPFSHVGIYIGEDRFVHAPSTNGKVRIDRLSDRYYAERYEAARSLLD